MSSKISKESAIKTVCLLALHLMASGMIYLMIFFSTIPEIGYFTKQKVFWFFINIFMVFFGILILQGIVRKLWISVLITSALSVIWSIANYYTVRYHGSPLFVAEFANLKTAIKVMGGYSFKIDSDVIKLLCVFFVLMAVVFAAYKVEKKEYVAATTPKPLRRLAHLIAGLIGMAVCVGLVAIPLGLKPYNTMGWSWKDGIRDYGFLVCSIENICNTISDPYKIPDGYSQEALSGADKGKDATSSVCPDIIVILNETFFDLEEFFEINPDESPLIKYYSVENAVYGYAPSGGGTNDTEYELLLSNSLFLLNGTSPFNFVELQDRFSVVDYMEKLGYATTGMHCGHKENYHRNTAYRELGFDNIILGEDDFKYKKSNYKRKWLDSENYKDMTERLDSNKDMPQFMFLLTYQNHGGYGKNEDSLDTVHTGVDYGEKNSEINEYLSSLKLSSEAFYDLTEELKDRRPTIVVMIGDHGPNFTNVLSLKADEKEYDKELARSLVPFVIWTNYKEVPKEYGQLASVEDLIPMALDVAGLPISAYYDTLLKIHGTIPLRNLHGMYIDASGNEGQYSPDSEYYDLLNEYYYMEYNSFGKKEEINKELFLP
ncbi:MAG: sulfatase-like hydrolase/transferase [Lachnospiraceae bacterium]|nr:sulfatase-like hydrolase/transferase [Lachnospiraceae bacterium]